jgi:hypothetical protein
MRAANEGRLGLKKCQNVKISTQAKTIEQKEKH